MHGATIKIRKQNKTTILYTTFYYGYEESFLVLLNEVLWIDCFIVTYRY